MEIFFETFLNPSNQIYQILISIFLGVFVGLRREMFFQKEKMIGLMGIRTLPLFALLGTISTFFDDFKYLPVLFFCGLFIFIAIAYFNGVFNLKRYGLTSEILGLIMFWVGVLIGYEKILLAIIITIILAIFSAYKYQFHAFAKDFSFREWSGALQLIIVSALILPLLPKEAIDPFGIFIPFNVWLIVILISGISFIGYFFQKYLGSKKSILVTSFLGAIVSSTATTISLSNKSHETKRINLLAAGIMLSVFVMQLRIIAEIIIISQDFSFKFIAISLSMLLPALFFFSYFYIMDSKKKQRVLKEKVDEVKSPFEILPALKFAVIFIVILFAVYFGKYFFGDWGAYFAASLASLVDADAVVLSILESFKISKIEIGFVVDIIMIAVVVNTLIKLFYVFVLGNKKLFKKVSPAIFITSLVGFIVFLFL
ncbi:MAG: DUF4010 domain-containing protein [Candidatus Pacebacteria bacterium]|nr:DUF4010 domain-containing protein [Candidatus Paceibacterota bacterium]